MSHQRSKIKWLREGDKNLKYFHAKASMCRKKNLIHILQDTSGEWVQDMEDLITVYFQSLFKANELREQTEFLEVV